MQCLGRSIHALVGATRFEPSGAERRACVDVPMNRCTHSLQVGDGPDPIFRIAQGDSGGARF
jgi:hypothetical protein